MKVEEGSIGRALVARFEDGEDFLASLVALIRERNVRAGLVFLVGAAGEATIVAGPRESVLPPVPWRLGLDAAHELLGVGTVFWEGDEPKVHLHAGLGRGPGARVGCIRGRTRTFLVVEAVILEVLDTTARRRHDEASGLSLLDFAPR